MAKAILYNDLWDFYDHDCAETRCFYLPIEKEELEPYLVDYEPVIHAHWETDNYGYAILNEEGHTMYLAGVPCSRCHVTGQTNWNYCPNCGAKMDEEDGKQ